MTRNKVSDFTREYRANGSPAPLPGPQAYAAALAAFRTDRSLHGWYGWTIAAGRVVWVRIPRKGRRGVGRAAVLATTTVEVQAAR